MRGRAEPEPEPEESESELEHRPSRLRGPDGPLWLELGIKPDSLA